MDDARLARVCYFVMFLPTSHCSFLTLNSSRTKASELNELLVWQGKKYKGRLQAAPFFPVANIHVVPLDLKKEGSKYHASRTAQFSVVHSWLSNICGTLKAMKIDGTFSIATRPETLRVDFEHTSLKVKMSSKLYVKLHSNHSQLLAKELHCLHTLTSSEGTPSKRTRSAISGVRPVSRIGTLTFREVAIQK